jgi:hypothetical protein
VLVASPRRNGLCVAEMDHEELEEKEVPLGEGAEASTRGACAPRTEMFRSSAN